MPYYNELKNRRISAAEIFLFLFLGKDVVNLLSPLKIRICMGTFNKDSLIISFIYLEWNDIRKKTRV